MRQVIAVSSAESDESVWRFVHVTMPVVAQAFDHYYQDETNEKHAIHADLMEAITLNRVLRC